MYSPKIAEDIVPRLYWLAKARRITMTKLVDRMIRDALTELDQQSTEATTVPVGIRTGHQSNLAISSPVEAVA